ncbi:putative class I hydrophobin superfamily [Pleurotus ostreatus PC15]|uniref:Hydrophobin n=1 Tax=Pleurotus ostreatus (strain PC15) TaxID=1137138 RepID=A0A067PDQ2_PLEO1|nr:putative class I hydrophobin superfamily [Pleurotus ostreatus PC15]
MARRNTPASSCSTSSLACFQNSGTAKDAGIASLIATLGIDVGDIDGLIGATCSPITSIGAGDASCSAKALCCDNNTFKGVAASGCVPVDLSL